MDSEQSNWSTNIEKIFVEAIRVKLSDFEDIPYPDVFHLYKHCLDGYHQLTSHVGFFNIDEDQIGINEDGVVKVWLSSQYQNDRVFGSRVNEPQMVRELLSLLNAKTNHDSKGNVPNIAWYIGNHDNITFR